MYSDILNNFHRRSLSFFLIVTTLVGGLVVGCDNRDEGRRLAEAGISASEKIAEFYDSLALDLVDTMELESFRDGFFGGGLFDDRAKQTLEQTITAIQARARLARKLGRTYQSLKELTEYDAGAEVKEAATGLAESIQGLPILPASAVIPSAIIGEVAKDLADWKQSKDIRRGAELLVTTLVKIRELMDKELAAYKTISAERHNKAATTIETLISKQLVASLPLLKRVPESLGLTLIGSGAAVSDEAMKKGLVEIARVRFYRQSLASAAAADAAVNILDDLISSHRGFGKERGSGISKVMAAIERIQTYLNEIQKLRRRVDES